MDLTARVPLARWLEHIERAHPRTIELGLERVRAVLERLGVTVSAPVITVAGTNGKGSVSAMVESILRRAGWRAALYTSPHLLRYNERVRIAGHEAGDEALCEAFETVESARGSVPLTYFEFGTLAAFVLFAREPLDAWVLEVGLGGRLDAVNAIDPDVAVLTNVGLDHMDYLGTTREDIGREKAGIFRRGRPAICADPDPPASVAASAEAIGAQLWQVGRDFTWRARELQWDYVGRSRERHALPYPALRGADQVANAAAALAALEAIGPRLPVAAGAVRDGLLGVRWPGRFQLLPGRPTVILDVAHNPHAGAALARSLRSLPRGGRTLAVFAMLGDKDAPGTAAEVVAEVDHWFVAPLSGPRGTSAEAMAGSLACAGVAVQAVTRCTSVDEAYRQACEKAAPADRIIVFGSFLTVAAVMALDTGSRA